MATRSGNVSKLLLVSAVAGLLIWLISNFGARVGPDLLKQMCERDA